jgi:cholesterol transport system auxiliary component
VTWVDTAPRLVQTLLVESFENSRKIIGVGRQSVNLRTDYALIIDLREFQ